MYLNSYTIFMIVISLSMFIHEMLNRRFKKYSDIAIQSGLTGREVAEKILHDAGIYDVDINLSGHSGLSDHYNPTTRELCLSEGVLNSSSISAASVAAHEAAHAIQHAENYKPLVIRSASVGTANFGSRFSMLILLIGFFLSFPPLLYTGVALYSLFVFSTLIALPVEFNASHRALSIMKKAGIINTDELKGAKSVLSAAAMTYVVSALTAVLQFLRLIAIANNLKKRD